MGKRSRNAVAAVLSEHYTKVGVSIVNNQTDLEALVASKPDLVFLGMKSIPREPILGLFSTDKIWLAQYLEEHGILHTGSDSAAHKLEFAKPLAKQRVLDAGLKTSPFRVVTPKQLKFMQGSSFSFPLFVKPTSHGGGDGIDGSSIVRNFTNLKSKVESVAAKLKSDSLLENYLSGREFSVAILKNARSAEFSVMPIELVAEPDEQGERLLSARVKSSNTENVLTVREGSMRSSVCDLAINAFEALGAQDYGRIDIRLDEFGAPHFLEANLIPSLVENYGSFPKACELNQNLGYRDMLRQIVSLPLERQAFNAVEEYGSIIGDNQPAISSAASIQ